MVDREICKTELLVVENRQIYFKMINKLIQTAIARINKFARTVYKS